MRRASVIAAFVLLTSAAFAADDVAVDVQNASEPTLCAEKDNVYLKLASPEVRQFKIESVHPNYIGTIVVDRSAFDLHNCPDLAAAPFITEKPRRITIFENAEWQLIGHTIPNFWRKTIVPVRVGDKVETGVQLLQLWTRTQDRAEEVLVLYPQDGYWRARPLPPVNLKWSAYGSSFLVGPVETAGRPFVDIKDEMRVGIYPADFLEGPFPGLLFAVHVELGLHSMVRHRRHGQRDEAGSRQPANQSLHVIHPPNASAGP